MKRNTSRIHLPNALGSHADELPLRDRARQWEPRLSWNQLDAEVLRSVAAEHGVDFATALLYDRLQRSAEHGPGIRWLEQALDDCGLDDCGDRSRIGPEASSREPRLVLVPGGCHGESRDSRECLERVRRGAIRRGYEVEVVPTASFGTLGENARAITATLAAGGERSTLLVSLSKGSAEVQWALRDPGAAFERVTAWVNVSGLVYGSQWVSWLLDRGVSRLGARLWCRYHGYSYDALDQLRRGPGRMLDFDPVLPSACCVVHVVGFPLRGDFTHPYAARSHRRLAHLGPTDGMGFMLGDLARAAGLVYPVWRADHFLRPNGRGMSHFVGRVLQLLQAEPPRIDSIDSKASGVEAPS